MPPGGAPVHGDMVATIRKTAHEKLTVRRSRPADRGARASAVVARRRFRRAPHHRRHRARLSQGGARAGRLRGRAGAGGLGGAARLDRGTQAIGLRALPAASRTAHRAQAALHRVLPAARASLRHAARRVRAGHHHRRRQGAVRGHPSATGGADSRDRRPSAGGRQLPARRRMPSSEHVDSSARRSSPRSASTGRAAARTSRCIPSPPASVPTMCGSRRGSWPNEPLSLFFGTAHETGHALYEQGIAGGFRRSLLGDGASLGVHESQSRLWENLVARSWPFWQHFFPAAAGSASRRSSAASPPSSSIAASTRCSAR